MSNQPSINSLELASKKLSKKKNTQNLEEINLGIGENNFEKRSHESHLMHACKKNIDFWTSENLIINFEYSHFLLIFAFHWSYYHTRVIISQGLYIFYPIFKDHMFVFKEVFSENSILMYGLYSRAAYDDARTVYKRIVSVKFQQVKMGKKDFPTNLRS